MYRTLCRINEEAYAWLFAQLRVHIEHELPYNHALTADMQLKVTLR